MQPYFAILQPRVYPSFVTMKFHLFQRPIHRLHARQRQQYLRHLLSLSAADRYLRFGYQATDAQIQAYALGIDFERDAVLGIYDAFARLIAAAHLSLPLNAAQEAMGAHGAGNEVAEFGVSVSASARKRGYGQRLFDRAALVAQNHNIQFLLIHALRENRAMMKIAHNAGADIEHWQDESEARLRLNMRRVDTVAKEAIGRNIAAVDYLVKWQHRRIWQRIAKWRTHTSSAISAHRP